MADSVYRVTEVIGVSSESWEAAARTAVETAAKSVRDLRVAEVSELDRSVAVGVGNGIAVPGFRKRSVKTNVTVRHGEVIVLSGVFSHDEQKAVSKFPGLGHIPIIGEIFKQRAFDESKRELVIFVTPRIVNPDTERIRKMIADIKDRYKQAKEEVSFGIFD